MDDGGVRARTVHNAAVGRNGGIRLEVVAVNEKHRRKAVAEAEHVRDALGQAVRLPDVQLTQERNEGSAVVAQQLQLGGRLGEMDGDRNAGRRGRQEQ